MPLVGMAYVIVTYGAKTVFLIALSMILMTGALIWLVRRKKLVVRG
jgi:hypothetical protein